MSLWNAIRFFFAVVGLVGELGELGGRGARPRRRARRAGRSARARRRRRRGSTATSSWRAHARELASACARAPSRACCACRGRRRRRRGASRTARGAPGSPPRRRPRDCGARAGRIQLAERCRGRDSRVERNDIASCSLRVTSSRFASPTSSAVMPSSRIFCWKFCRYMPISSAAFVMLPPWRRSASAGTRARSARPRAPSRRGTSAPSPSASARRTPRRAVAAARRRRSRSAAVISSPGASSSACSTAELELAHVALPVVRDAGAQRLAGERLQRRAGSARPRPSGSGRRAAGCPRAARASGGIATSTTRRR